MEGVRQPVGDLPPQVYWRRRLVVLGVAILTIVVIYFLITAPRGTQTPGANSTKGPEVTVTATASGDTNLAFDADRPCEAADVTVTATPNPFSVASGSLPVFDVSVSMKGVSPCKLTVSPENSELLIMSGSDRIFSSLDCSTDATINAREFILQPDSPNEMFQLTWNRQRSAPECATVTATPRPGYYKATVTLQGVAAEPAQFELQ